MMKFKLFAALLLLFIWTPTAYSSTKTIGLWTMMLWFEDGDYKPWEQYVRYHPVGGTYNSWDITHIDELIKNADDLGVDYLILDNTNGAFRHDGRFDRTIDAVIERIKFNKSNLKVSIAIGWGIWKEKNFKYLLDEIAYIDKYFSDPSYFNIDGKPLLVLYINPEDSIVKITNNPDFIVHIDRNDKYGYRNFFSSYAVRYASGASDWLEDYYGLYGWQFKGNSNKGYGTLGVMPGWNRSHNELTGSTPVERNGSDFYTNSWNHVISQNPQNIVITSYDDWAEETFIAPTLEYGNIFLEITKDMIKKYKWNLSSPN